MKLELVRGTEVPEAQRLCALGVRVLYEVLVPRLVRVQCNRICVYPSVTGGGRTVLLRVRRYNTDLLTEHACTSVRTTGRTVPTST